MQHSETESEGLVAALTARVERLEALLVASACSTMRTLTDDELE